MFSSVDHEASPDYMIIYVRDGSTVAESIARKFKGEKYNLDVELFPLDHFQMRSVGSSQSLCSMATSPPTKTLRSASITIPPRARPPEKYQQHWTSPSSVLSSSSPSSSLSLVSSSSTQSPVMSPAPLEARSTMIEGEETVYGFSGCTIPAMLVTPGMMRYLRAIDEDSRASLTEFLDQGQDPVALECFVTRDEVQQQLEETFNSPDFRWRHLEIGESRESFGRCVIGLMTLHEEGRDTMPLPSLKRFSLLPDKPVLAGDSLYLLLDSRVSGASDSSILDLRYNESDHVTARRISDLLYEFHAPDCTEKFLPVEVFTIKGDCLGRESIQYADKGQMLTSLLLQLDNPVEVLSRLFPADLVSRHEIDVAFSDWLTTSRFDDSKIQDQTGSTRGNLAGLLHVATQFSLSRLVHSLVPDTDHCSEVRVDDHVAMTTDQLTPSWSGSYLPSQSSVGTRDTGQSRCRSSSDYVDSESSEDTDYVKPDSILALQDTFSVGKLCVNGRKFSSSSCPEIRDRKKPTDTRPPRCFSLPASSASPTYSNQADKDIVSASKTTSELSTDSTPATGRTAFALSQCHTPSYTNKKSGKVRSLNKIPQQSFDWSRNAFNNKEDKIIPCDCIHETKRRNETENCFSVWESIETRESQNIYESLESLDRMGNDAVNMPSKEDRLFSISTPPPLPPPRRRNQTRLSGTQQMLTTQQNTPGSSLVSENSNSARSSINKDTISLPRVERASLKHFNSFPSLASLRKDINAIHACRRTVIKSHGIMETSRSLNYSKEKDPKFESTWPPPGVVANGKTETKTLRDRTFSAR